MDTVGPATIRPGGILDGAYELLRPIGRGGMATVYEGRALDSGRIVAVKVLRALDEDPDDARRRFFQEVQAAAALQHPGIVPLHDFGVSADGVRYLVMERLHGHTVGQELRRFGRMDPDRGVPRLLEALDAIEIAHARGIIHSDLKPTNLFLREATTAEEALVVLDFGVAHRPSASPMQRAGTPQYAPPELLLGQQTEPATDVYQLGLVLAEILTGQAVLHDVTTARECLDRLASGRLALPVPAHSAFREVVEVAVAPDPRQRFPNVGELREALLLAWLRHRSGPRASLVIEGPVPDDAHTVPFDDGSLDAAADAEVAWVEPDADPPSAVPLALGVAVGLSGVALFAVLLGLMWAFA